MKHSIRTFNLDFLKSYSSSDGQIMSNTSFPVSCYVCDSFRSSDFSIDVPKGIYLLDDSKPRGAFQLHLSALQQIPRVLTREGETLMEEPKSKTVFAFHKDKAPSPCPLANEAVAAVWQQPRVTHCGVTQAQAELKTANKKSLCVPAGCSVDALCLQWDCQRKHSAWMKLQASVGSSVCLPFRLPGFFFHKP